MPGDPNAKPDDPNATQTDDGSVAEQLAAFKEDILGEVRKMIGAASSSSPQHQAAQEHTERHLDRASAAEEGLEGMVDRALGKALGERDKATAEDEHKRQHEQLAAATAEKAPVERTRRHKLMGWGEPG